MKFEIPSGLFEHRRTVDGRGAGRTGAQNIDMTSATNRVIAARSKQPQADPEPGDAVGAEPFRAVRGEWELANANAILAMHPDPLLLVHGRRQVVRANAASRKLFGEDILHRDLASVLNEPEVLAATDAILGGASGTYVDFTLPARVDRHFRARIEPLPDYAGDGLAALLTITDFTELKRVERMRADFVANASHELRTPLAILLGFIETLNGSAADDPEAQRRFLPIMHQQAARMARLVDDLLSLSRIELTEHALPSTQLRIPRVLRVVAEALRLRAAERGMSIELKLADRLPLVVGDRDEISQVFQNLIDNAIKYAAPNTAIVVTAQPSAKLHPGVAISIRDHGEGIADRHLTRLTERFFRVDTARSRAVGGTGLGLAIVKHVVNRHRGILEIDSRLGEGSTFTVHLGGATAHTEEDNIVDALQLEQPAGPEADQHAVGAPALRIVGSHPEGAEHA